MCAQERVDAPSDERVVTINTHRISTLVMLPPSIGAAPLRGSVPSLQRPLQHTQCHTDLVLFWSRLGLTPLYWPCSLCGVTKCCVIFWLCQLAPSPAGGELQMQGPSMPACVPRWLPCTWDSGWKPGSGTSQMFMRLYPVSASAVTPCPVCI